ncbi:tetratricopeptide repeat protein [Bifidobacterium simiarum]|uniref:tetratricopeptide repeat protein n=1 Tax=Bifidobacterium simiarum TaxID=2045441 RepID=UPI001BDBC8E2|nr:tetratricopeptide repeat protein [Bifidobacterium simiarum]
MSGLAARFGGSAPKPSASADPSGTGSAFGDAMRSAADGERAVIEALTRNARPLGPLTKKHILDAMPGVPEGLAVGWAQFPETRGRGFTLGVFPDRRHCAPVAFVDDKGRVFAGEEIAPDVQGADPVFLFAKEEEILVMKSRLEGRRDGGAEDGYEHALQGGIVGRDENDEMMWLASWLKSDNRYTLEQLRPELPVGLRAGLEYRDAIASAFFATYLLPRFNGVLIGFGSGNIFRRLRGEAPIGAIRRSVKDTLRARAHGLRASGLEDHFADLMNEAGALDKAEGLEAVHGAEPLKLFTSPFSGGYFFGWDSSLEFRPALTALRIEGNLNRFADVSLWLERNGRIGANPTEDNVTHAQAAQLDRALLLNPALTALKLEETPGKSFDPVHDDGTPALAAMVKVAGEAAQRIAAEHPDPLAADGPVRDGTAQSRTAQSGTAQSGDGETSPYAGGSEWVYRQTFSSLVRRLRLPYRFDAEFRSNLADGNVAIGFTTAGTSMMPSTRYDEHQRTWVDLSDAERASMSTDYNLRVGLMMAALAFGVDEHVRKVSLHVDSIGLEEAVDEQDSAISAAMGEALSAFERIRTGRDLNTGGGKADPKDGDVHGNPAALTAGPVEGPIETGAADGAESESTDPRNGNDSGDSQNGDSRDSDSQDSMDETFRELMKGVDLDEMMFADPGAGPAVTDADADGLGGDDLGGADLGGADLDGAVPSGDGTGDMAADMDGDDPLAALRRNPTVRNLVTVTFERDRFLEMIRVCGLNRPQHMYRAFNAVMDVDGNGGFKPITADFDIRDHAYSPHGSQEEPELSGQRFPDDVARVLGARDALDLAIQRADVLQRAVNDFHALAANDRDPSPVRAERAMDVIHRIADPELDSISSDVTSALIDGRDTPDAKFTMGDRLDEQRLKARDMLFSGQPAKAISMAEAAVAEMDRMFSGVDGVPRYFNSYAERVVYNRLFATPDEHTVLIPDNLFYAHMELADVLAQIDSAKAALPHLNAMVAYAPAYPLSHLKMAIALARTGDWESARAACLNALRVALDRDDASFAYYRLAYSAWMRDEFAVAAAAYIMSDQISSGGMGQVESELAELMARARSQCIAVPQTVEEAQAVLEEHDLPVWPNTEVAGIVRDAARVCVDNALFVPARTLSMAAARMKADGDGLDAIQIQFLRSLNA